MPRCLILGSTSERLLKLVERAGLDATVGQSLADAAAALDRDRFDLALADVELPDGTGLELVPLLANAGEPRAELVLVTPLASLEAAVDAFRGGAADVLSIPADVGRLRTLLARIGRATSRDEADRGASRAADGASAQADARARAGMPSGSRCGAMIGASPAMQAVYDQLAKVAPTEATVLITGETGTGKEVVAAALHALGARAGGPFCSLNCGAISPNLVESELFGHERGSFTGALRRHEGVFERARGGTLFLDEITEMSPELQVKLLRALESREILRIGAERSTAVDVRVVAATNRDPHAAVAEGRLREDLLYRLLVFPIALPPLRERGEDVQILAEHFLARLNAAAGARKSLSPAAVERLRSHDWPGNVRELENTIERAFILSDDEIGPDDLALRAATAGASAGASPSALPPTSPDGSLGIRVGMPIHEAQRRLTLATLAHFGEKKKTAEVLGISLKTLYTWLKTYAASAAATAPEGGARVRDA